VLRRLSLKGCARPRKTDTGKKAAAIIEYVVMVTLIMFAMIIMHKYIDRALGGRWKVTADSFDHGRGYDENRTVVCDYDYAFTQTWFDPLCFEEHDGDCTSINMNEETCQDIITGVCRCPYNAP
jgi:Flp pilus assembly pilin Flp